MDELLVERVMRGGHNVKPRVVRELEGPNGGKGRKPLPPAMVPEPPHGEIPMPRQVAENPRALHYWRHFLRWTAPGHLLPNDGPALARACLALARADAADEEIEREGMMVQGRFGPEPSKWLAIQDRHSESARRHLSDLCLTVATRNKAGGVREPASADPAAAYLDA